jgi:hypothetical protein
MSRPTMTDPACQHVRELSAELALGGLDGRERAEVLAHVERCTRCQHELASLVDVADRLAGLIPSAEPPAGFETRVLRQLTPRSSSDRPRRMAPTALRLSAAAALVAAVGLAGWAVGRHDARPAPAAVGPGGARLLTASFVAGGRPAGQAVAFGGRHPWVAVEIDSGLGNRTVRCVLDERDGTTLGVGTFTLAGGYGYWSVPIGVAPSAISSVRLLDPDGAGVAAATFGPATS